MTSMSLCRMAAQWALARARPAASARSNPGRSRNSSSAGVTFLGWYCSASHTSRSSGTFTTASNADFDAFLRARDPDSGIRDAEAVDRLALAQGLVLAADHPMPANNQLRVWRR